MRGQSRPIHSQQMAQISPAYCANRNLKSTTAGHAEAVSLLSFFLSYALRSTSFPRLLKVIFHSWYKGGVPNCEADSNGISAETRWRELNQNGTTRYPNLSSFYPETTIQEWERLS